MELKYINIAKNESYQPNPDDYTGKLKYTSKHGDIEVPLDNQLSREVIALVAASLVRASKNLAEQLTTEVLTQAPALEHKDE